MSARKIDPGQVIDMPVHVGLRGNKWPAWGKFSDEYMQSPEFGVFPAFAGLTKTDSDHERPRGKVPETIVSSRIGRVVRLAPDLIFGCRNGCERHELRCILGATRFGNFNGLINTGG